jgi:hypothetical protein
MAAVTAVIIPIDMANVAMTGAATLAIPTRIDTAVPNPVTPAVAATVLAVTLVMAVPRPSAAGMADTRNVVKATAENTPMPAIKRPST